MTVAELIEYLRALPQDLPVFVACNDAEAADSDDAAYYNYDISIDANESHVGERHPRVADACPGDERLAFIERPRRVVIG